MRHKDLISYTDLAGQCGVSPWAISKFVRRNGLPCHRLPYSAKGKALGLLEAEIVLRYYEARRVQLASA